MMTALEETGSIIGITLVYLVVILLVLRYVVCIFHRRLPSPAPPLVPYSLPFLGSALELNAGGASFLKQCQDRYGDVFTLYVAGQRMTFVLKPSALPAFFKAPDSVLSFAPAVEQFTKRVFGLPPQDFLPKHHVLLDGLRHQMLRGSLPQHAQRLLPLLKEQLLRSPLRSLETQQQQQPVELYKEIKNIVFPAAVSSLFGTAFFHQHGGRLQDAFFTFEACFEMAASPIPHIFQPTFCKSRGVLLKALKQSLEAGHFEGTIVGTLIETCNLPNTALPHMLLAVLWASQANTVPAAFWAYSMLLIPDNQHLADQLVQERLTSEDALIEDACNIDSLLCRCCLEAIRLRSPSIDVRIAASDWNTSSIVVPKGDVVAVCPWMSHLDERVYPPRPWEYDPYRSEACFTPSPLTTDHDKKPVAGVGGLGGISFGGGRYRCPGRAFAEMELALVVGLMLMALRLVLDSEKNVNKTESDGGWVSPGDRFGLLPLPNIHKLVGVKVPLSECMVRSKSSAVWIEGNEQEEKQKSSVSKTAAARRWVS